VTPSLSQSGLDLWRMILGEARGESKGELRFPLQLTSSSPELSDRRPDCVTSLRLMDILIP
jgi:hypothetical protein